MSLPAGRVSSPESDAAVIGQSWVQPGRFAAIFGRYFREIHRYLARRAGEKVADDLAGVVFLAAFAQRARYDLSRESAGPWLYGIAANLAGSHRRQEARYFRALARTDAQPGWQAEGGPGPRRGPVARSRPDWIVIVDLATGMLPAGEWLATAPHGVYAPGTLLRYDLWQTLGWTSRVPHG